MSDTYKLQLRHGAETRNFSTRDEVIGYINGQLQYGGVSLLPYEPILFFYGADDAKNAIIMVGLPEGKTQNGNSYFLVDTADLKKQIESLDSQYDDILQSLKDEEIEGKLLTVEGTEFDPNSGELRLKSAAGTNDIKVQFSFNFGEF